MLTQKSATLTLRVEDASKEWNGKPLFKDVTFELFQGEKVALFGKNGVGKTSLLKAIMGQVELDTGIIHHGVPLLDWGWLEQDLQVDPVVSLNAFVRSGNLELSRMASELSRLERALEAVSGQDNPVAEATGGDDVPRDVSGADDVPSADDASSADDGVENRIERLMKQYAEVQERYQACGGYEWETEVEVSLTRLQLPRAVWETPYQALSGGQKTRAQLARLMVRKPKALILDEPTNHLDVDTRERVEEALLDFPGALVLVTHDLYLLRKVANRLVFLENGNARWFEGTYEEYEQAKAAPKYEDRETENQIRQLELTLAQLVGQDEPESEEERVILLEKIRSTKRALNELRGLAR